jgi:hypothetical protein
MLMKTLVIGNGFLGSYLADYFDAETFSLHDADYTGNILDETLLKQAIKNKESIIYTIGFPPTDFSKKHSIATQGLQVLLKQKTKAKIIFISAAGADEQKSHPYFKEKGKCERLLQESDKKYQIIRPSVLAEKENALLKKIRFIPIMPYVKTTIHPMKRKDVAKAIKEEKPLKKTVSVSMKSFLQEYTHALLIPLPQTIFKLYQPMYELVSNTEI